MEAKNALRRQGNSSKGARRLLEPKQAQGYGFQELCIDNTDISIVSHLDVQIHTRS